MSEAITTTSLKTLLKFPFQGPNWQNRFIIGTALILAGSVIPIVPLIFVCGYALQVMRQAIEGEELVLPAWDDWGKLATDGLRAWLVSLVYFLPGALVFFGGMGLYFVSSIALPLAMEAADEGAMLAFPILVLASMSIMFLSMLIGSLLFLLGAIPLPAGMAHFAVQDKVSAAFSVGQWWPLLRVNKLGYFIDWVIVTGLIGIFYFTSMMAYYTIVLCCVIPFLGAPLGFYLLLVSSALFGETYRESKALIQHQQ